MNCPTVSVVMSVYNGQRYLYASVASLLAQTLAEFELIVVNDGSTDGSREILAEYEARDSRIRVIDQDNEGLTRALIRGCSEARGEFIARQDADDLSLPTRLERQWRYLRERPEITLVSCWSEFIGPEGELLFSVIRQDTPEEATRRLRADSLKNLQGINGHGSAFFRRLDYLRAGGYRAEFRYAQDMDLWSRLTDSGRVAFVSEVLYRPRVESDSISVRHSATQTALGRLIIQMRQARDRGEEETALLQQVGLLTSESRPVKQARPGSGDYFLGRLLQCRKDPRATEYLRRALRADPMHLPARWALVRATLGF